MEDEAAPQMGGETKSMEAEALASLNNVVYELEPAVSVATSRTMKEYLASNDRHYLGQDPIQINIASGNQFVDLKNSYMSFDVNFENMGADTFASTRIPQGASWLNLFDFFKITHASGVEVDRQNSQLGVWRQIRTWWDKSAEWRDTVGAGLLNMANQYARPYDNVDERIGDYITELHQRDLGAVGPDTAYQGSLPINNTKQHVVIPLQDLFDWADKDELCPPYLMSGLRLDLKTLAKERFFQRVNDYDKYKEGTVNNYELGDDTGLDDRPGGGGDIVGIVYKPWNDQSAVFMDNIRVNLCSYSLTDSMTRRIAEISASRGLEWSWNAVAHVSTLNQDETFTMQISQALSRANAIIVKARVVDNINRYDCNHFASLPWIPDNARNAAALVADDSTSPSVLEYPTHSLDGTCLEMQARVGAMYLPAQPLRGGIKDFYHSALQTFGAMRRADAQVGPTLGDFGGHLKTRGFPYRVSPPVPAAPLPPGDNSVTVPFEDIVLTPLAGFPAITTAAQGIYAIPLESSPNLKQSGLAISAQRTAEVNFRFKPLSVLPIQRRYDMFIPHTKVATLFLGDVCVVRN